MIVFEAGDRVSHKGNVWNIMYQSGGLIRITRDGVKKVVRLNQVVKVEGVR